MNILELVWYTYFRFSRYTCRRNQDDAKVVASLMTALLLAFITFDLLLVFLHFSDYTLFVDLYHNSYAILVIGVLTDLFCSYYFFYRKKISKVNLDNFDLPYPPKKRRVIYIMSWIAILIAFILTFGFAEILRPVP